MTGVKTNDKSYDHYDDYLGDVVQAGVEEPGDQHQAGPGQDSPV